MTQPRQVFSPAAAKTDILEGGGERRKEKRKQEKNYKASFSPSYLLPPRSYCFSLHASSSNFPNLFQIHLYLWFLHYLVATGNCTLITEAQYFCMWNHVYLNENISSRAVWQEAIFLCFMEKKNKKKKP